MSQILCAEVAIENSVIPNESLRVSVLIKSFSSGQIFVAEVSL